MEKASQLNISSTSRPFIIAEMSGNHNQSLDRAMEIIKAAAESGVNAIKLQTYTADTLTINHKGGFFDITDEKSLWAGRNLYDLYTPWEWHKPLFEYANKLGLVAFSSPFDETAVDFLESLNVPLYKVASFENNHHPLLKKIARTGKPIIMSTGISSIQDISESVEVLMENGCEKLILLKCTSTYPSTSENTNLATIPYLKEKFPNCLIGLSDHTMGVGVSIAAIGMGACVIEKHFTLRRSDGGVDSAFSMEPEEMKVLVDESEKAWLAIGKVQLEVQQVEQKSLLFKRSIYVVKDINEGELLTEENIRVIRPGNGEHPRYFESLIGKKVKKKLEKGTPFSIKYIQ
ncbi:MAG: pseudaminic acid synthase [Bacteroidetes bacterium]|nr:pseudaminic acid synthase [Bacteroidota bacterium]